MVTFQAPHLYKTTVKIAKYRLDDAPFLMHCQRHQNIKDKLLWPPCVADADIIFLPCGFFLFFFYLFFSSPNLSGRRLDVYHTSTHGVALVQI